ncbi:hypothetical protein A1O1_02978 [Capronia coronata CBS 617.96]|uniref:Ribosomal RNA-processing protein 14/surfeit locus protein 6 C-terminal domain-containing protein n=1 Tax=Capronia coronata CBS 617.96 TaxID=1182541 RepID=W9YNS2_9EURO|nr:uncharacterized protein A1O1_02978 [Capronia coronata CBS 617.96]EXJ94582.1 hypothetical protein A1O1_02978 [Capronia coronata CBS 617.96]
MPDELEVCLNRTEFHFRLFETDQNQERLKSHARAFDSLLSLIPANLYYGGDVSDQWQRKKQTPEQKKAAKMAKLDPDNWKSAKDVMEERAAAALKRKRTDDEELQDDEPPVDETLGLEVPKALQDAEAVVSKKRKIEAKTTTDTNTNTAQPKEESAEDKKRRRAEQKAAKRERKRDQKLKAKEKLERQKARKAGVQPGESPATTATAPRKTKKEVHLKEPINLDVEEPMPETAADDHESTASSEADQAEEVFSPQHESATSSTSSIQPATIDETLESQQPEQKPHQQPPQQASSDIDAAQPTSSNSNPSHTSQTPRERLQAAISQLRASRKADGGDGRVAPKNRQELLEQRRRKEEERKAAKKEQKRREKEEEARRQDEEIARRFSPGGSGSLLASPRSPILGDNASASGSGSNANNNYNFNFSYGRIAFEDGSKFDPTTAEIVEEHKKKGPRDPASALKAALAKKERLTSLDEQKRQEIEQKDMWLNAKKRAHGEHVRDDTSLLKKALKRQQGQKRKSEREWSERLQGVQKAQDARQKKRTENLARRKDEKKSSGGGVKKDKKVKRPGFEGSFKGRTGGKRKS